MLPEAAGSSQWSCIDWTICLSIRQRPYRPSRRAGYCAPPKLKAAFFAVMASFTNLALSLSQLLTKYANEIFIVTREVRDPLTNAIQLPADYSHMGHLFIVVTLVGLALPMMAILFMRVSRFQSE